MSPQPTLFKALKQSMEWTRDAFILAGVCMLCAYPFYYYQAYYLTPAIQPQVAGLHMAKISLLFHMLMTFAACLISAMVGIYYSKKLGLAGFENIKGLSKKIMPFLGLGIILIPLSYLISDQAIMDRIPEYFTDSFKLALGQPLIAMSIEVTFRFGLVTILVYLLRWLKFPGHPWPAPLMVAAFISLQAWLSLSRLEIIQGFDLFTLRIIGSAFILNILFGEIYIRRGIIPAIFAHLGLEAKYLIYSFLG